MASKLRPVDHSQQSTPSPNQETPSAMFVPKDTLDRPCDVILVAQDAEFKAHCQVLSEASPFFEKLLNSDMKESKEGVIRLVMFTESVVRNTLEFIYTGNVQILDENDARELVVLADYLFLQNLKSLAAQVLQQKLNTSNCILIFRFANEYRCEKLVSKTKTFILANFPAIFAASCEDVLEMSNKELAMWISSDELHVSAEEEVFNIILAWINHDKNNRKKHFAELFRHVRLVYISRDFLCSDIVTNDLVKNNEDCLDLATEAIHLIVSERFDSLRDKPRKSLETSVLVTCRVKGNLESTSEYMMSYFPREDRWYTLGETPLETANYDLFFCHGKLFGTSVEPLQPRSHGPLQRTPGTYDPLVSLPYNKCWRLHVACYNPHSNAWKSLPSLENRHLLHLSVCNDEMYALFTRYDWRRRARSIPFDLIYDLIITKYKTETNSWQDVMSTDLIHSRGNFCVVSQENFVYFIGGRTWVDWELASKVDRFELSRTQWDELADIQVARESAHGAAANGKIWIAGGDCHWRRNRVLDYHCEMYDVTTNEWQFVKSFSIKPDEFQALLAVDNELYVLGETLARRKNSTKCFETLRVECYNADSSTWSLKTELTTKSDLPTRALCGSIIMNGSIKVFPGFLSPSQNKLSHKGDKRKCSIM